MRLFIHALAASAGGGITYLRNTLPHLAALPDVQVLLLAGSQILGDVKAFENITRIESHEQPNSVSRFLWEQREVPRLIRSNAAEVLICTGNFAIWRSPIPQILLSRNSLYTSADFQTDLWRRREYRLAVDTRLRAILARKSVRRAELTIAPSEAFARQLTEWAERKVIALHHGFDRDQFFQDASRLSASIREKLASTDGCVKLLHVSHYNYYRNFETLFRGLAILRDRGVKVKLLLTCDLTDVSPSGYRTTVARNLLRELKLEADVVQLGLVPYQLLHHLYRSCDLYVTAAYTETFAHPLVEAMACGAPIVASDIAVHREITNGVGVFFPPFSASDLANRVSELVESSSLRSELVFRGLEQSRKFDWKAHVDRLLELAKLVAKGREGDDIASALGSHQI